MKWTKETFFRLQKTIHAHHKNTLNQNSQGSLSYKKYNFTVKKSLKLQGIFKNLSIKLNSLKEMIFLMGKLFYIRYNMKNGLHAEYSRIL